jgi:hypothetical protein
MALSRAIRPPRLEGASRLPPNQTPAGDQVRIRIASHVLHARLELAAAPRSCAAFTAALPLTLSLIHARWSGECAWAPLGDTGLRLAPENATRYPRPGEILIYTGEISEPEILLPYGAAAFASKAGPLAGNHIMTVTDHNDLLAEIGDALLWRGALPITFEREARSEG